MQILFGKLPTALQPAHTLSLLCYLQPTLELLQTTAPSFVQMVQPRLQDAKKKWQQLAAAGVKHPQQTYPEVN